MPNALHGWRDAGEEGSRGERTLLARHFSLLPGRSLCSSQSGPAGSPEWSLLSFTHANPPLYITTDE